MTKTFKAHETVIVSTGQAGSIWWVQDKEVAVYLRNGDIWYGFIYEIRYPQDNEEAKNCPLDVDKPIGKRNGNYGPK